MRKPKRPQLPSLSTPPKTWDAEAWERHGRAIAESLSRYLMDVGAYTAWIRRNPYRGQKTEPIECRRCGEAREHYHRPNGKPQSRCVECVRKSVKRSRE